MARKHTLFAEATARAEVAEEERDRHAEQLISAAAEVEEQRERVLVVERELEETRSILALKKHLLSVRSDELTSMKGACSTFSPRSAYNEIARQDDEVCVCAEQAEMVLGSLKGSITEADQMQMQLEQRCAEEAALRSSTQAFAQQSQEQSNEVVAHVASFADQVGVSREAMEALTQSVHKSVADSSAQLTTGCTAISSKIAAAVSHLNSSNTEVRTSTFLDNSAQTVWYRLKMKRRTTVRKRLKRSA